MTIAQENADLKTQLEAATAGTEQATGEVVALKEQVEKLNTAQAGLLEKCGQLEAELTEAKTDQADVEELAGEVHLPHPLAAENLRRGGRPVREDLEVSHMADFLTEVHIAYTDRIVITGAPLEDSLSETVLGCMLGAVLRND